MTKSLYSSIYTYLHKLPPEIAHWIAMSGLKMLPPSPSNIVHNQLKITTLGMVFPNPIGLAAGFDKNAKATQELINLGFGFVEIGTVTLLPQRGNRKPRLFKLVEDNAIINRMGFNNDGSLIVRMRLFLEKIDGIFGVSIGPNIRTKDYLQDFTSCITIFAPMAKYITINVSSPNTQGLRELQEKDALSQLLFWALNARNKTKSVCPILIKISPDITLQELDSIVDVALFRGIDGIIIANTTISRPDSIKSDLRFESGGLSGPPLLNNTIKMLSRAYNRIAYNKGKLVLIGSGGISDGKSALKQIMAGATLLQIYTSFIYQGPMVIDKINSELLDEMKNFGVSHISDLIGINAKIIEEKT